MIPEKEHKVCREGMDTTYSATPDSTLDHDRTVKATQALMNYTGVRSPPNVGLVAQNDGTTVGPEAAGKFTLSDIATSKGLDEYLSSWGFRSADVEKLTHKQKKAEAAKYQVGGPYPKKRYYSLNPNCVSGPYAFNAENRSDVSGGSGNGSIVDGGSCNGSI